MEKLILLFDRFEARNGIHDGGGNELVQALFARLTRGEVLRMAERQDLAPVGERPWVKHLTGGSDDHGGFYVGTTWTETPAAVDVGTFLAHLAAGATVPGGAAGSTPRLTQSIYGIADGYAKQRLGASRDPFRATLARLGLPEGERPRRVLAFFRRGRGASGAGGGGGPRRPPAPEVTLRRADRTVRKGVRRFLFHSALQMRRGNLAGGLASLAHLAPAAAALVPFLFALHAQHKDSVFLRKARRHFTGEDPDNGRKVWVTDTFGDVNGVARTVETVGRLAVEQGRELKVLTCRSSFEAPGVDLVNFKPLVAFPLPGYKNQLISVPPAVEIYHRLEELKPDEIIISTPGPVGLVALSAARLLGIRVSGIYHTDFPAYLRHLIGPSLEDPTWAIMRWFYGGMERVYVRSLVYRELLLENGFAADQVRLMPRAVDTALFRPGHRDPGFWARHGGASADADGGPVFRFVYVGRVSKEKNLDALFESFDRFLATGRRAELAVVGDGPYLEELRERFAERRDVLFTGVLRGEELAAAYASGDLFVFPSLTDTLGNAVLEAQASGLAAVVTHRGGPKELVRDGISGLVVDVSEDDAFRDAMIKLYDDPDLRAAMGKQGVEGTRRLSWDVFLADLWRETPADDEAAQRPAGPSRVASLG
jgi:glycosyltransferase involved in cell wall biosynthesis